MNVFPTILIMNNKEFIAELSQRTGYSQTDTKKLVRTLIDEMGDRFSEGDAVYLQNFGTFEVKKRLERIVVNPGTQQRMLVPPKLVLNFRPISSIKEILKNNRDKVFVQEFRGRNDNKEKHTSGSTGTPFQVYWDHRARNY